MSVWSWKRSGWVNSTLAASLIIAVITGICSTGIRTGFRAITPTFNFYGGLQPEIGIFNLLLYFSALFGFISVALRYSYILDQNQVMPRSIDYVNKSSLAIGVFSFLGLVLIASFPVSFSEKESSFQSTGTYIFIGLGFVFTVLQTVLTYTSLRCSVIFIIRLCLAISLLSTFISSIVLIEKNKFFNIYSNFTLEENNQTESIVNLIKVNKEQVIACGLEWASVVVYALFYLSFVQEFQKISTYIILRPFIVPASNDFRSSSLTVNERV